MLKIAENMGEQRVASRESEDSEKGYKNWKPELVKSMDILDVDPDLVWQKFGTFGRYQVLYFIKSTTSNN